MKKVKIILICIFTILLVYLLFFNRMIYGKYTGYHYALDLGGDKGFTTVTVRLDLRGTGLVTSMYISCSKPEDVLKDIPSNWNRNPNDEAACPITYRNNGHHITLNFYNKDFDLKDAEILIKYLGLEEELSDGKLNYKKELLNSDSFIYGYVFNEGQCTSLKEFKPY